MKPEWKIEKRAIKDIRENPINPRQLTKDQEKQLATSIEKFGQCEPLVINTDGFLIGGHQRLRILKKQKEKEADVYVPTRTLSEREVQELNIRLNKNVGSWDFDILANAWDTEDLIEWGFTSQELEYDVTTVEKSEEEEVKNKQKTCPNCGEVLKK
jgi:ParB-like chromosome segregation protein Spo0J